MGIFFSLSLFSILNRFKRIAVFRKIACQMWHILATYVIIAAEMIRFNYPNGSRTRPRIHDPWLRFDHGEDEFFNKFFSRRQLGA